MPKANAPGGCVPGRRCAASFFWESLLREAAGRDGCFSAATHFELTRKISTPELKTCQVVAPVRKNNPRRARAPRRRLCVFAPRENSRTKEKCRARRGSRHLPVLGFNSRLWKIESVSLRAAGSQRQHQGDNHEHPDPNRLELGLHPCLLRKPRDLQRRKYKGLASVSSATPGIAAEGARAERRLRFQRGKRAGEKAAPPVSFDSTGRRRCPKSVARTACYFTVTVTEAEGIPFATTTMVLGPSSMVAGTSKWVVTLRAPVATPMLVWPCVRQ